MIKRKEDSLRKAFRSCCITVNSYLFSSGYGPVTSGTKQVIFRLIWFWNWTFFKLLDFFSSFLAYSAWLFMSDARNVAFIFFSSGGCHCKSEYDCSHFPFWSICSSKENWGTSHKTLGKPFEWVHPYVRIKVPIWASPSEGRWWMQYSPLFF